MHRIYSQSAQIEHGYIWSEKDIQTKEDIFEDVFQQFFTERFRNKMFPKDSEYITTETFVQNMSIYGNY